MARDFSEGLAAVKKDDLWGYIDASGKMVIPPRYHWAQEFEDGRAEVTLPDGDEVIIDRTGNVVAPADDENDE